MKKRLFCILLAVVMIATAINFAPAIPKTTAYSTAGTNDTWNNSYHSLVEGKGNKSTPGFTSPYAYTLKQSDNEYNMPNQWHVAPFNMCEISKDPQNGNKALVEDDEAAKHSISTTCKSAPGDFAKKDGGKNAYFSEWPDQSDKPKALKNIGMEIHNFNSFDIADYSYLRFEYKRNDVVLATELGDDNYYFRIQLDAPDDHCIAEFRCNDIFTNYTKYDLLLDVRSYTGVVDHIEIHLYNVRRNSNDGYSDAYVAFDNFRFIKNATHTQYFGYKPVEEVYKFHSCDSIGNISKVSYISSGDSVDAYDISIAPSTYGNALKAMPRSSSYGKRKWYQICFGDNGGVQANQYDYFRFFMKLGSKVPVPADFKIYFRPNVDYSGDVIQKGGFTLSSYKMQNGWYNITIRCDDINMKVKSLSLQFAEDGSKNSGIVIGNPGSNPDDAAIYVDNIQFIRYRYEPMTEYPYLEGHYQVLQNFEDIPDSTNNTDISLSAFRYDDMMKAPEYKNGHGYLAWYTSNTASSNVTRVYKNGNTGNIYSPQREDTVTQGKYSFWWRPNTNSNEANFTYSLSDAGANNNSVDLSKFTHFSLDMAIRNPNLSIGSFNGPPSLAGNNDSFLITLIDANNATANLRFVFNRYGGYENIVISRDWGVYAFPLEGFVPGYGSAEEGYLYSASGPMRLVFSLGKIMQHRAGANFDITKVKNMRITYEKNLGGADARRFDLFFDNLVAFTPDMKPEIQLVGADPADLGQRMVIHVNGNSDDAVSNHVEVVYSACPFTNNGKEIIRLPLNGYTVIMEPWAWRYHSNKELIYNTSLERRNDTWLTGYTGRALGYETICQNKQTYLHPTVTFNLTRHHPKWLDHNSYSYKYASDIS